MSTELVMPSKHLIFCRPLLLPLSIFPSTRVFSNESVLHIRWPKYWSFSFSISPSNEYSGPISFRKDWLNLLAYSQIIKVITEHESEQSNQTGLPWWYSREELACQCRGQGFNPWSRKIPHAMEQLSPNAQLLSPHSRACELRILQAAAAEARTPRTCAPQQEKPPQWEARAPQWKVSPTPGN